METNIIVPDSKEGRLAQLGKIIQLGLDAWRTAGEVLVTLIDKDHMTKAEIVEQAKHPSVQLVELDLFERVGRGTLHPDLIIAEYPAADDMVGLPYSDQLKLQSEPIEVVVMRAEDKTDTLKIAAKNLTKGQCKQVFDKVGTGKVVRTLGAQRAWLEAEQTKRLKKKGPTTKNVPWEVKGKVLIVHPSTTPTTFTRKELLTILQMLE